jgi:hypothetical protein
VRADWRRVQSEVAYVRMMVSAHRLMTTLREQDERKFNPYHDDAGRFTTAEGDTGGGTGDRPQLANRRIVTGRVFVGGRTYTVTRSQERDLVSAAANAAQAVARVRKVEEGWQSTSGPFITDPNSADGAIRVYRDLAQEANGRALVLERGGVPLGFNSRQEFRAFGSEARNSLMFAGQADAELYLRGSSVTGYRYRTGEPFDAGKDSDYDFAIVSPRLMERAHELGIATLGRGTRTGPLREIQLRQLGLDRPLARIKELTDRKSSFVIFRDSKVLEQRGPSLWVP